MAEGVLEYMDEQGRGYPFEKVKTELEQYDFVFSNLETPITDDGKMLAEKPYIFALDPDYASVLNTVKLDAVSIANNHIMDYGRTGLENTLQWLDKYGIARAGAGRNLEEARKPAIFRAGTTDIIILAYNERPPAEFDAGARTPGAAPLDMHVLKEDIRRHRTSTNLVLVSLHWGIEQTLYPRSYQVRLARAIIDAGADAIIGHHPHWPQGIEIYRSKPIFYSLGNFINGFYNLVEKNNFFAVLHCKGNNIHRLEIIPIAGKNTAIDFQPYILTGKEATAQLRLIRYISSHFKTEMTIKKDRGYIRID